MRIITISQECGSYDDWHPTQFFITEDMDRDFKGEVQELVRQFRDNSELWRESQPYKANCKGFDWWNKLRIAEDKRLAKSIFGVNLDSEFEVYRTQCVAKWLENNGCVEFDLENPPSIIQDIRL